MTTKESLVEVSPSTVTRLNEPSASSVASCCISAGAMAASVAMKPSMVAMLGRIMPAPLLMPVTVTVLPPTVGTLALNALAMVSVVMMPSAARSQWLWPHRPGRRAGRPSMRSAGSGSMMTPVENGSICWGEMFR
jgi:hypothetical protein